MTNPDLTAATFNSIETFLKERHPEARVFSQKPSGSQWAAEAEMRTGSVALGISTGALMVLQKTGRSLNVHDIVDVARIRGLFSDPDAGRSAPVIVTEEML